MSKEIRAIQKELRKGSVSTPNDGVAAGTDTNPAALYRLVNNSGPSKAEIWRRFGVVVLAVDGEKLDYAACNACLKVYTFKPGTGTSSMIRHACAPQIDTNHRGRGIMNVHFRKGILCRADKQRLTTSIADFCALDMRPFAVITGSGFKAMIQTTLDIAVANSSSGRLLVKELLATPKTIRLNVETRAAAGRQILQGVLEKHLATGEGMCCTLDLWTDSFRKNSYMSITAHYVDEHFDLHDRTLHVKPVRDASHTASMVLVEFKEGIGVFNFTKEWTCFEQIVVVSDSRSNYCGVDGIPSEFPWLACLDLKLSTCLTTVLNKTTKIESGKRSKPFYRHESEGATPV